MNSDDVVFTINPKLDYLFGYFGDQQVRTKQDGFKPVEAVKVHEDGHEEILKNFYVKKPSKESHKEFEEFIRSLASETFTEEPLIQKPQEVEVFLGITMTEKRFKEVDIDNLAKAILDCLVGIAFEDDSQVSSLIVNKYVHPMKVNGLFIGITKLTDTRRGFIGDISLFKKGKEW